LDEGGVDDEWDERTPKTRPVREWSRPEEKVFVREEGDG